MVGMESSATAFLAEIEAFLARESVSSSSFGRAAVGDPNFVRELREGRAPSLRLVDRARAYMVGRRRAAGVTVHPPEAH
jgi:sulfate adenylyltransferase subunit 2